jgi:hypothetical protein
LALPEGGHKLPGLLGGRRFALDRLGEIGGEKLRKGLGQLRARDRPVGADPQLGEDDLVQDSANLGRS